MSLDELRIQNIQNVTEKALVCFIKNGITNTKVSEIAKTAGLTERSVYRYFPTKSDIVISAAARFSVTPVLWQLFKSCDTQSSTEWTLSIISISPRSSNLKSGIAASIMIFSYFVMSFAIAIPSIESYAMFCMILIIIFQSFAFCQTFFGGGGRRVH